MTGRDKCGVNLERKLTVARSHNYRENCERGVGKSSLQAREQAENTNCESRGEKLKCKKSQMHARLENQAPTRHSCLIYKT